MARPPKYQKSKKQRDYELEMASINGLSRVLAEDPEFKYYLGMIGGYSLTGLVELLEKLQNRDEPTKTDVVTGYSEPPPVPPVKPEDGNFSDIMQYKADMMRYGTEMSAWKVRKAKWEAEQGVQWVNDNKGTLIKYYTWLAQPGLPGFILGAGVEDFFNKRDTKPDDNVFQWMTSTMQFAGLSFGTFCATVLILKAMFGDSDSTGGGMFAKMFAAGIA